MEKEQKIRHKYFIVSDIHSFCWELKDSLKKAGFVKSNPEHVLIVLGDIFDRGEDAVGTYKFLKSIPKKRRVMIKGNHEWLFLELLNKSYPQSHDFHNYTVDTFCQLAYEVFAKDELKKSWLKWCNKEYFESNYHSSMYSMDYEDELNYEVVTRRWSYVVEAVKNHPVTKWIKGKEWVNYYELDKYIFVHSFIPVKLKQEIIDKFGQIAYGFENPDCFEYDPQWRESQDWDDAIWGCPWSKYQHGLFLPEEENGKVLVCGHWHTTDFFKNLKNIKLYNEWPIYFSDHLIGLDGGVHSELWGLEHDQNVMVIDDSDFNTCYDQDGFKLMNYDAVPVITRATVTVDKDGNVIRDGMKDFIEED